MGAVKVDGGKALDVRPTVGSGAVVPGHLPLLVAVTFVALLAAATPTTVVPLAAVVTRGVPLTPPGRPPLLRPMEGKAKGVTKLA